MFTPSTVRLGKLPAKLDPRNLMMADYLAPRLPKTPVVCDRTVMVTDLGMMLNDQLGDCVIASGGHTIQTWTAEAGSQVVLPDSIIEGAYSAVTGYTPGRPETDRGTVIIDFLNYWRQVGVGGHKIGAYVQFNPSNQEEFRQAVYYFGAAFLGVLLPIAWQGQPKWTGTPTDDPDTVPGTWGGHGIPATRYDQEGPDVVTWGSYVKMDWSSLAYCDEAFALVSVDQLNGQGINPAGLNLAQLQDDLRAVTAA